jgi:hypothetical protein
MAVNPLTGTAPKIVIEYDNPDVTVPYFAEPVDEKLKRELFTAAARVFGREPDNLTLESASNPLTACEAQSDESTAEPEREAPAVCRWCKGTRQITVNFKTKRCEECAPADPPSATKPTLSAADIYGYGGAGAMIPFYRSWETKVKWSLKQRPGYCNLGPV